MEWLILALFCLTLLFCIVFDFSVLVALAVGLLLFLFYGKYRGHSWSALGQMAFEGVKTVKNILITFFLIGILTALWRAAGTIPTIVCCSSVLIRPPVFLLMTFLLNCGVSVLTGTSFATAATMGSICISMATALHMDLRLVGGAVLSGVYFGDRCSPVSTSAILISELTGTNIFDNIKRMLRSACIPFLLSCVIYVVLGFIFSPAGEAPEFDTVFRGEFTLHRLTLIPAALILLLSVLRVNVKWTMTVSILASIPICIFLQHISPFDLLKISLIGFYTPNEQIGAMMNGGGVTSMLKVAGIVCLSSSYSGVFRKTGLLDGLKHAIAIFSAKTTAYTAALVTSIVAGIIACNQSLAILLTDQLCRDLTGNASDFANDLEDTAVVIAPLVPWSIACAVPLASAGAPVSAVLCAYYLYLLPLWRLGCSLFKR